MTNENDESPDASQEASGSFPVKTCAYCKVEKSLASFHKNHQMRDGLQKKCKECISTLGGFAPIAKRAPPTSPPKTCNTCGVEKPAVAFYRNRSKPDGLYELCKPCCKVRNEKYEAKLVIVPVLEKGCSRCKLTLPASAFGKDLKRKNGLGVYCRTCTVEEQRERRATRYGSGLTPEKFKEMVDASNGRCTICGGPPTMRGLHLDHDHKSGKIRGLLCGHCNLALGHARDSIELLGKMIEYLKKHQTEKRRRVKIPDSPPDSI